MVSQALALFVDDEPSICWGFRRMLEGEGHRVLTASSAEEGLKLAANQSPRLVVLDVRLPGMDGISALPRFMKLCPQAQVVIMTAFGDLESAVTAIQGGACEYLTKPFRLVDALRVCRGALEKRRSDSKSNLFSEAKHLENGKLVGHCQAMQLVFRQIAMFAPSNLSVLITGETGTGKELVSAAIHEYSPRNNSSYFPIAPIAFSPDLIESELFGHAKGAFTGANDDRVGIFEQAEGGTILLDEIGDLSLSLQVKLLRVLESGHFLRVGENRIRRCDVRVIAATNADLALAVKDGRFREDLYYRLKGMHIHLPPLRERFDDLEALCEYFLNQIGYPNAESAMDSQLHGQLSQQYWPGNVRELKNAIHHAAAIARGRRLNIDDFPPPEPLGSLSPPAAHGPTNAASQLLVDAVAGWLDAKLAHGDNANGDLYQFLLNDIEPTLFARVLKCTGNNKAKAAELLGLHRGTLRERLRQHGLDDPVDLR